MKQYRFLTAVIFLFQFSISAQQEITLARYPALSSGGEQVAFSFQGDIWVMDLDRENAIPRRLTIHEAYESHPVFSPDAKEVAFSSNRFGHNDVFTLPLTGGRPQRLTYHSANDQVTDWPAKDKILFETQRIFKQVEWDAEIYQVPSAGGTPTRALDAVGEMATQSHNGRYLAFVRGACRISRESYRGPSDNEIWVYDRQREKYLQITDNEVNDFLPRWDKRGELYYLSSINGRYNVVKVKVDGYDPKVQPEVLTEFTEEGVRWFDVAGDRVVMERSSGLYLMENDKNPREIQLNIATDYRFDPVETKTFKSGIDEFETSPNGKLAAMVIRGEVFVKQLDKEKTRTVNLSRHTYRDRSVAWLNDSVVIFASDRDGQYDLYLARSSDPKKPLFQSLKHEVVRLTETREDEFHPVISPDRKKIAYTRGRGQLLVADIDPNGKMSNSRKMLDGWATPGGVSWSPDSRYLAYSKSDLNFNSEVYIQDISGGDPVNVSMHPRGDYNPYWSKDGTKLGFLSSRQNGDADVWFVWLRKEDWLKTKEDIEEGLYFPPQEQQQDDTTQTSSDSLAKGLKQVEIDLRDIHDRLEQVTSMPGDERSVIISNDGKTFYFTARSNLASGYDLFKIGYDGADIAQLTEGGTNPRDIALSPDGKKLLYTKAGVIHEIVIDNKKTTRYPHEAVMTINRDEEREQIFEEAWNALRQGFYDPEFHGKDWEALKEKYKPRTIAASTTQDFREMFNWMLGELNASHMGLYGSDPEKTQKESVGMLGMELMPVKDGVRILKVVTNSPADRPQSQLKPGETIIAVGGEPVREGDNFYRLMAHQTGKQVLMTVKDSRGREREVVIRPTSSLRTELYEDWVRERQRLVEEYSNGRLGYIHIQGMNKPSFERFERELMASGQGKEGIVIDVRFNGGGWTTDYLMAVLTVRQHAYTVPRGAAGSLQDHASFSEFYPYSERLPLSAWVKPSIAMCNESSYSNAEIFSHAYKNLGIGTLVGMPTFGAVISTGGMSLLDGSYVRMPFRGWYVKNTAENMEGGPAVPDILVDNKPGDKSGGEDPQLKKAVEILLEQIDRKN